MHQHLDDSNSNSKVYPCLLSKLSLPFQFSRHLMHEVQVTLNFFMNKIVLLLCHSHIELILRFRLRLNWGLVEVEMRLSWSLLEIELKLSWGWAEWGLRWDNVELRANFGFQRTRVTVQFFRSSHVAEQHLFSMFPSVLTFNLI